MTRTPTRLPRTLGTSMLAMFTGWVALLSWRGLIDLPRHYLGPALVAGFLLAAVGAWARALRVPWYAVPLIQVVVCALFVNHHYYAASSWHRWVPTPTSVRHVWHAVHLGAVDVNKFTAPVSADRHEAYIYLLVCSIGIMLAIDLLACGLGRVPLAGLPILLTLSIPISVLVQGLSWVVFVATAFLFLMLLSTEETRRVLGWGRTVVGNGTRWNSLDQMVNGGSVRTAAVRIGMVTTLGALMLPLAIPVGHDLFGLHDGNKPGNGPSSGIQIVNPLVDLRRDLAAQTHTPLVYLTTDQPDPEYLRMTVLDEFTGTDWRPSSRHIPKSNQVHGAMPAAPGSTSSTKDDPHTWDLRLASTFETRWLPTPYPASDVTVDTGDWRYDVTTLDIVDAGADSTSRGMSYQTAAANPRITSTSLNDAFSPPTSIVDPMTKLPANLPKTIKDVALQVTRGATTEYAKVVALQDWFRSTGGFTYSTAQRPGSGTSELARFITTDKVGYCEQFAAAMAVMGRTLGIPSRVSVGFRSPDVNDSPDNYIFTSDELHAWPEMYFAGVGWVHFEPTPSVQSGRAPAYTRERVVAPNTATESPTAPATANNKPKPTDNVPAPTTTGAGGNHTWIPLLALIILVLLVSAAPRLLRDSRRRMWLAPGQDPPSLAAGAWAELQATATDLGITWPAAKSPRATGQLLVEQVNPTPEQLAELDDFVEFVERARYARPFGTDDATQQQVLAAVQSWSALLASSVRPAGQRLARVFPRSVLARRTPAPAAAIGRQAAERV